MFSIPTAMTIQVLLAEHSIGVSEFKRNPARALTDAGNEPIAVLAHNKAIGYFVTPNMFASMRQAMDLLGDIYDAELAEKRWTKQGRRAIKVDIDDLGKL